MDALDETIREIRSAIYSLQTHGGPEAGPGARARIRHVTEELTGPLGFAPSLRMDSRLDAVLPDAITEHLLAVLREALSNTARHAHASRADITVSIKDSAASGGELVLSVRDNGGGMPAATSRRSGLANMADRASSLGGTLRAGPADGSGTEVEWRVPLPG